MFWSGSYISNSLFSEHIIPNLSWLISKKETIGSLRVFHDLLRFITEIIIIYFIYVICKLFNYNKEKEVIFFVIICLITLYLNRGLTETFYPNRYRDIPILLVLIVFSDALIVFSYLKLIVNDCYLFLCVNCLFVMCLIYFR